VTARETRAEATYVIRTGARLQSAVLLDPRCPKASIATGRGLFLIRPSRTRSATATDNEITLVKRRETS
jgi:hypothetical protein